MSSHRVQFFQAACSACGSKFPIPLLSDFSYGEFIFHGQQGGVFGFLSALEEPAWESIETHLRSFGVLVTAPMRADIDHLHRVIAASADPIGGQSLIPVPVCPSCQSRSIACGDSAPLDIPEVSRVTFANYKSMQAEIKSENLQKLWRQLT